MTDRAALRRARERAKQKPAFFLFQHIGDEIQERLEEVNKTFTNIAVVSGFPDFWRDFFPTADFIEDTNTLDFPSSDYDLVLHLMCLHWADDPVGQIVQCRRVLKSDGLLLTTLFGGKSLSELREAIGSTEIAHMGGLSPRVIPMGEIRDLGALLQRGGLALPVADSTPFNVTYRSLQSLVADLRGMGETNSLASRQKSALSRAFLRDLEKTYFESHAEDGKYKATFEVVTLTGWAPDDSQQKPLRPGSATSRLADALKTDELPLEPNQD